MLNQSTFPFSHSSKYISNLRSVLEITDDSQYNTIRTRFGPLLLDILNGMSQKVGPMQFYLGISTQFPEEFDQMAQFALDAHNKLGDKVDAFMLGNVSNTPTFAERC